MLAWAVGFRGPGPSQEINTSVESKPTIDPPFTQVTDRRRKIRGLLLNLNWRVGKPQKEDQPIDSIPITP